MQATIDNDKSLSGRFNWRWTPRLITKVIAQIAPSGSMNPSAVVLENEYAGSDFSASIKGNNISLLEGGLTGTVSGDYFQAITPRLSLGLNAIWERPSLARGPDMIMTYGARYKGLDWIGSARLMPMLGLVQLSYWRKLADKVEAGVNMELSLASPGGAAGMMGPSGGPEGQATIGAKYDFRGSVFRGQVDSNGRVSCMLEKRLNPMVACTFVGSIDHVKVNSIPRLIC
jgi:mitochondrial import receptor subunit TOM40